MPVLWSRSPTNRYPPRSSSRKTRLSIEPRAKWPSFRPTRLLVFLLLEPKMTPARLEPPGVRIKEIALHDHVESSTAIRRLRPVGHPRLTGGLPPRSVGAGKEWR